MQECKERTRSGATKHRVAAWSCGPQRRRLGTEAGARGGQLCCTFSSCRHRVPVPQFPFPPPLSLPAAYFTCCKLCMTTKLLLYGCPTHTHIRRPPPRLGRCTPCWSSCWRSVHHATGRPPRCPPPPAESPPPPHAGRSRPSLQQQLLHLYRPLPLVEPLGEHHWSQVMEWPEGEGEQGGWDRRRRERRRVY